MYRYRDYVSVHPPRFHTVEVRKQPQSATGYQAPMVVLSEVVENCCKMSYLACSILLECTVKVLVIWHLLSFFLYEVFLVTMRRKVHSPHLHAPLTNPKCKYLY